MTDLLDHQTPQLMRLLPTALAARVEAASRARTYGDGQVVHLRGDRRPGVSIIKAGAVRVGVLGADGSFNTVSVLGPGHCFGEHALFSGLPRTHDVSAVGVTTVLHLDRAAFLRLFDGEPQFARALMTVVSSRASALLQIVDDMRRLSLADRTAKLLASMAPADQTSPTIDCSQSDLGFALGVSRVAIGHALGRLEADGLVERGYGRIRLPDLAALRQRIAESSPVELLAWHAGDAVDAIGNRQEGPIVS